MLYQTHALICESVYLWHCSNALAFPRVNIDSFRSLNSLDEFVSQYDLSSVDFTGELEFVYPDWSFTRYMIIGTK